MRQLLDRYLLWTPSHAPIDSTWLARAPEGLSDLVKTSRWATTFKLASEELLARPLVWGGCLLLLLALCELRRRAPARIQAQSLATQQPETDHIVTTWITFGWTILAALPLPASLALISLLLQTAGTPGRYSDSLGRAFGMLVVPLFMVQLLRWTLVEGGLGHSHFRWKRARRVALRRALPRATAVVIPMYFVMSLAFIRNLDLPNDVQARVAVVTACGVLAWTFWRLLDVEQVWVQRGVEGEPSSLRKLLRLSIATGLFVVAVLALAGYVYSAGVLLQGIIASINTVIAVSLALGLLARWFLVGERRLALRRLETQREAAEHASKDHGEGVREVEAEITLEQVNAQTRRLLRALRIGLLLIGLAWVWAEVLPAITRLDEIVLWTFDDLDASGTPIERPVTLMAALFGASALALTVFGSRNLPGLVELGLLSQTSIDTASRYAITSILRYVIVITGSLIGLQLFGMRWSQLQWMAAALTVGLGFGLQEIFANFVSGLILLFERPFRVGDVISVGDLSGRVTRIRTRATTILDFDNREIVVPNKNFITGQLLNWTLSDTTTRITIKVGVAYGSDPDQVHSLLLQAAAEQPLVLREPEPRSLFMAFGGSSLDFELRVFVGTLNDRLPAQSDLHRKITHLFSAHRIEIAFPQLDLHVRDLPESSPPG
jgi:potassium efflux system protein